MHDPCAAIATQYDAYAEPQRRAAADLLAFTGARVAQTILEPGCGTGLYTRLLLAAFPRATLLGIDRSSAMLAVARERLTDARATFLTADAEYFATGRYELITSNAVLQWFTDLPGSLARLAGLLAPGGALTFSFFGPETYRELDQALRDIHGDTLRVTSHRFAAKDTLATILRETFRQTEIEERTYTQTYPTVRHLLRAIRNTGTRGTSCIPPIPWTPRRLAQIEAAYRARQGEIHASYQVLLCSGTVK